MAPFVWEKSTVNSAAALTTTANTKLSDDINPCFDARRVRENCPCVVCIWGEFAPLLAAGNRPRARFRNSPEFERPLFPRRDSNQHHAVARHGCLELVFEVAQVLLPPKVAHKLAIAGVLSQRHQQARTVLRRTAGGRLWGIDSQLR